MSVTGIKEAYNHALSVTIADNPNLEIKVASPAGMLILKLISQLEREPGIRCKDAMDIYYLTIHYAKIPEIADSLYNNDYMEAQDYDEHKASTMKLADDAKLDNLILDISRSVNIEYDSGLELTEILKTQLKSN